MKKQYSSNENNDYTKKEKAQDSILANSDKTEQSTKKNYLVFGLLIAIIAVLLVGVIYQFVCIKKMQHQLDNQNSQAVVLVENSIKDNFV